MLSEHLANDLCTSMPPFVTGGSKSWKNTVWRQCVRLMPRKKGRKRMRQ